MKIAIVDLGSNSVRCVIYDLETKNGKMKKVFDYKKMLQIIGYVDNRELNAAGQQALSSTLREYSEIAETFEVDSFNCFATASLRNLDNQAEVLEHIRNEAHVEVTVLTGLEEAEIAFRGASQAVKLDKEGLSVDIGGGSTEIVHYKEGNIVNSISLPMGCLSIQLSFIDKALPTPEEHQEITAFVNQMLDEILWLNSLKLPSIIGIGGTSRAASKASNALLGSEKLNEGDAMDFNYIHKVSQIDAASPLKMQRELAETVVERFTTIIPGSIILSEIGKRVAARTFILSRHGIREGYLYNRVLKEV